MSARSFEQSRPAERISVEVWDMIVELEPAAVSDRPACARLSRPGHAQRD